MLGRRKEKCTQKGRQVRILIRIQWACFGGALVDYFLYWSLHSSASVRKRENDDAAKKLFEVLCSHL